MTALAPKSRVKAHPEDSVISPYIDWSDPNGSNGDDGAEESGGDAQGEVGKTNEGGGEVKKSAWNNLSRGGRWAMMPTESPDRSWTLRFENMWGGDCCTSHTYCHFYVVNGTIPPSPLGLVMTNVPRARSVLCANATNHLDRLLSAHTIFPPDLFVPLSPRHFLHLSPFRPLRSHSSYNSLAIPVRLSPHNGHPTRGERPTRTNRIVNAMGTRADEVRHAAPPHYRRQRKKDEERVGEDAE